MKTLKTHTLFLLLFPLLMSCESEEYSCQPNQKVLFQFERSNYAWGHYQMGWFIDQEGFVRVYDQPQFWMYPVNNRISGSDMDANLLYADSVCFRIDRTVLSRKVALIKKASEGKLSEPASVMADFGALLYYCYTYDSITSSYQSYLLSRAGDVEIQNTSKEAKELYVWLMEVNKQVEN